MSNDRTILVKKPDGTTVRVPLSQLNVFKKPVQPTPPPAPPKPVASSSVSDKPIEWKHEAKQREELAAKEEKLLQEIKAEAARQTPSKQSVDQTDRSKKIYNILKQAQSEKSAVKPVANVVKEQVAVKKPIKFKDWTKGDAGSLLSEKAVKPTGGRPLVSQSRDDQVEKIVGQLDFTVAPDNQNRLRSVIQLRLKDIRDREHTRETLLRPILRGGLGLLSSQADQVLRLTDQLTGDGSKPLPRRDRQSMVKAGRAEVDLPTVASRREAEVGVYHEPLTPAKSTPFNAFIHSQPPAKPVKTEDSKLKLGSQKNIRPVMQDIKPVVRPVEEVGPVEEIVLINLTDFRRLSANPAEAASRLSQKFKNLRDESYLLYLDGLKAWRQSPLFNSYMVAVEKSLMQRKPLSAVTTDKSQIQLAEIKALVDMEKEL